MKRLLCILLFAAIASAQDDPVARARTLAQSGQRAEALQLLEARLATSPEDNDARTLYGIVLSWEGEYGRARTELQRVLASDPTNDDAREALARVEQWSRTRPPSRREVSVGYAYEDLPNDFEELHVAARFGIFTLRAANAFEDAGDDQQLEVEAYPRLAARTYVYAGAGVSTESTRYPEWRAGAELFHGFGDGYEASLGLRRLEFTGDTVTIRTASLGKYFGNWLVVGRVYHAGDVSVQTQVRRYFGDEGGYAGLRAGSGREEFRSGADVESLGTSELVAEVLHVFPTRWTVHARAGVTRLGEGPAPTAALTLGRRF